MKLCEQEIWNSSKTRKIMGHQPIHILLKSTPSMRTYKLQVKISETKRFQNLRPEESCNLSCKLQYWYFHKDSWKLYFA